MAGKSNINEPRRRAIQPSVLTRSRKGTAATSGAPVRVRTDLTMGPVGGGEDSLDVSREVKADESEQPLTLDRKAIDAEQIRKWTETWGALSPKYEQMRIKMEEYLTRWNRFR